MNHPLRHISWTPILAATFALPLTFTFAEDDAAPTPPPARPQVDLPAAPPASPEAPPDTVLQQNQKSARQAVTKQGERTTMHGPLVNLGQYIESGDANASATGQAGPWAVLCDEHGLVILSDDAARVWRGPRTQVGTLKDDESNKPLGIEKRQEKPASPKKDATPRSSKDSDTQDNLTLQSNDPDANFRIVGREGSARINAKDESTVLGIERSAAALGSQPQLPREAVGEHVKAVGKLYERDGVRFLRVESIELHDHSDDPAETP